MKTTIILILAYVANVFLNRWLNKKLYQRGDAIISPLAWFVPILTTLALLYCLYLEDKKNWFTGKNWQK